MPDHLGQFLGQRANQPWKSQGGTSGLYTILPPLSWRDIGREWAEAQYLILQPSNFLTQSLLAKADWELLITMSNGILFTPMHEFRGTLTDQQMLDVLSYIRSRTPFGSVN